MNSVATGLAISLLLLAAAACGDNKPPPANPETPSSGDGGADMPAMGGDGGSAMAGDAGGGTGEAAPQPKPAALDLPAASANMKVKIKGKDTEIEIKNDGTVNTAGKPTHKIMGMELQDKDGKGLLKADADGNVTQSGDSSAYGKFEGDDLTMLDTSKLSVGDDGVSQTDAKGKKTALGKAEGVGSAKKATLMVVAFNLWGAKPPAAPKGAKPGDAKKPGDKPGDTKKPSDKPAPKK